MRDIFRLTRSRSNSASSADASPAVKLDPNTRILQRSRTASDSVGVDAGNRELTLSLSISSELTASDSPSLATSEGPSHEPTPKPRTRGISCPDFSSYTSVDQNHQSEITKIVNECRSKKNWLGRRVSNTPKKLPIPEKPDIRSVVMVKAHVVGKPNDWKKVWLSLKDDKLYMAKSEKDHTSFCVLRLEDQCVIDPSPIADLCSFRVRFPPNIYDDTRWYSFCLESNETKTIWMNAMLQGMSWRERTLAELGHVPEIMLYTSDESRIPAKLYPFSDQHDFQSGLPATSRSKYEWGGWWCTEQVQGGATQGLASPSMAGEMAQSEDSRASDSGEIEEVGYLSYT
ncbi:uncharacterized protein BJ171DRAFT_107545 [Polychytrium aggregatum]|uniref:uncharacterized protein n=1 Tax=Polychytrium aggregatum TaxID=110093 RepID=UPI0022FDCB72|nr:uncharacterized protein BJ171DRAFT_107545 [Polychytrium aggregatum]KAI9204501.1 hypothetical protein BJ171DRAFT_107545 [Polychytrium aggregatum]